MSQDMKVRETDTEIDLGPLHRQWVEEDQAYREAHEEEALVHRVALRTLQLRQRRGWSQQELADRLDVTQGAVAQLEGGFENPTVRRLVRLARALEVEPEALVTERPPEVLRG